MKIAKLRIENWAAGIFLALAFLTPAAASAATIPLSGYAWSETIGWVSFKDTSPVAYGVLVDTSNGNMSGYAWAETLGWLSFNQSDTSVCGNRANLDTQSGVMDGWAKWLSTGECVHLKGSNYGVVYSSQSNEFSGYSWGDTHTGWMKWKNNSPAYAVVSESPIVSPPEAPSNPSAQPEVGDDSITVGWEDNSSGETGFQVERKEGENGAWELIETTNPNVEVYMDEDVVCGITYFYRVRAVNNGGYSVYTPEVSATVPCEATINVNIEPNSAGWTINPGNIQGTGDQAVVVNPSGGGTVYTLTPGSAPTGYDFPPAITNSQGGGSSMTLFDGGSSSFTVTYQRSFNYTLSNGGNITVEKGAGSYVAYGQTTVTRTLTGDSGPTQQVDLSVSNLPSGVTVESVSNNPCSPNCTSTVTLAISASANAGTYNNITVTGSPLGKTTVFTLTIENSPDIFVSCSSDPLNSAEVGGEVTWTASVSQTPSRPPYGYTWSGNTGTSTVQTASEFSTIYSTTGVKTVNVLVTNGIGQTAVCNPAGSINIGVDPSFEEF